MESTNYSTEVEISRFNYELAHKLNEQAKNEIDRINKRADLFVLHSDKNFEVLKHEFIGRRFDLTIQSFIYALKKVSNAINKFHEI